MSHNDRKLPLLLYPRGDNIVSTFLFSFGNPGGISGVVEHLSDTMQQITIPLDLLATTKTGIWRYFGKEATLLEVPDNHNGELMKSFASQNDIGWGNFLKCRVME